MNLQHLEEYDRRKYGSVMLIFYANRQDLAELETRAEAFDDSEFAETLEDDSEV